MEISNPRDYIGYGRDKVPDANWPGGAKIALQFVLNYEEGGENCVLHGDPHAETFLSEIAGAEPFPARHMSMESLYEYGSRAGVWRILNEFKKRELPLTIFGIATALQRNPEVTQAFIEDGHEIACHGLKWIHYQNMPIEQERQHMHQALELIESLTGKRPIGWYTGRDSPNTRELVAEQDSLLYDSDYYGDDLPFWTQVPDKKYPGSTRPHLIVPYTLDTNDMRFSSPYGFSHGEEFFQYLKENFDCLYAEGAEKPKMMSVGLHCRVIGKPSRFMALKKFLDYVAQHEGVWVATREQIARHWIEHHPA
ncbi:allantoinase PuuE [Vibrio fluvialis]|uniref:allantoinase PuuE n=1 Tax=Vibrio fluvialis TaxID=676 RepID=UPI001C9CBFDC|nr:allantoinase PuuE [Vibrio fluvialis]EKO3494607.1 allantoinase PuuE [Vibrio fluvialis]MBY7782851.1 allantoinase PuuE [Vibrio fluvialis]MBY7820335.1 allantoinase PuuE [Vibrio fluvialis]MBY8289934.1 allantoinase PuuE [Vibrio fluvialis]MCE7624497.1 allantoinase PuuE [Vibrio fluvialis]